MNRERKIMLRLAILAVALGMAGVAKSAPMGTAFTYQGRLYDANSPAEGEYDFEFAVFDALDRGSQQGSTVDVDDVDVTNGYFTVQLDFGSDPNIFSGDARWLQIAVRPGELEDPNTYSALSPRQEMTPVPYAMQTRGIFVDRTGNVGITTTNPSEKLDVNGKVSASAYTGGSPLIFEAPSGIERMRIEDSGNVGIGTPAPSAVLHVRKTTDSPADSVLKLFTQNTPWPTPTWSYLTFESTTINATDTWGFNTLRLNDSSSGDVLLATGGGYVGIGTDAPLARLHVEQADRLLPDTALANEDLIVEDSDAVLGLYSSSGGGYGSAICLGEIEGGLLENKWAIYRTTGFPSRLTISYGNNAGYNLNNDLLTVDAGGNVGIGTTIPDAELDVAGTVRCEILEITGADVAEKFPATDQVKPGMVVAIDPEHPGQLCLSRGPYNRCVAGIVSGANDLAPGAVLGSHPDDQDTLAVALSGRVWVYCDARDHPIEPGELLTTAELPGHAMAVRDYQRAQGAVIGKAMTRLNKGNTGHVLVLVSLQ